MLTLKSVNSLFSAIGVHFPILSKRDRTVAIMILDFESTARHGKNGFLGICIKQHIIFKLARVCS
jgi:hypothetical protein